MTTKQKIIIGSAVAFIILVFIVLMASRGTEKVHSLGTISVIADHEDGNPKKILGLDIQVVDADGIDIPVVEETATILKDGMFYVRSLDGRTLVARFPLRESKFRNKLVGSGKILRWSEMEIIQEELHRIGEKEAPAFGKVGTVIKITPEK